MGATSCSTGRQRRELRPTSRTSHRPPAPSAPVPALGPGRVSRCKWVAARSPAGVCRCPSTGPARRRRAGSRRPPCRLLGRRTISVVFRRGEVPARVFSGHYHRPSYRLEDAVRRIQWGLFDRDFNITPTGHAHFYSYQAYVPALLVRGPVDRLASPTAASVSAGTDSSSSARDSPTRPTCALVRRRAGAGLPGRPLGRGAAVEGATEKTVGTPSPARHQHPPMRGTLHCSGGGRGLDVALTPKCGRAARAGIASWR
jgi:hypothetical protein